MRRYLIAAAMALFMFPVNTHHFLLASEPPSPAAAMRKLLESGRVPEPRLPTVVKMICERGNRDDLAFILAETLKEKSWDEGLKAETLGWLIAAAAQRKVIPSGDSSGIAKLIGSENPQIQKSAIELAGLWQVHAAQSELLALAKKTTVPFAIRKQSLEALTSLDKEKAQTLLQDIAANGTTFELRAMGTGVLAELNLQSAAKAAAEILQSAGPRDQPAPILDAFLQRKGGTELLAARIKATPPSKDMAKLLLRQMYSVGRTDPELNDVLLNIAEINQNAPPPTKEKLAALVSAVSKSGDPVRGELVFRRADLSCLNCHAVSKGGGDIGPDLSAVGSSSPVEYLVMSLLDPDQAIKEAFVTKLVATVDGKVLQGIVVTRTDDTLVLKDATGKLLSIPTADIEDEVEGKSLMPRGLTNFMTDGEFLDLVAFLAELGKPGPYGIRETQRLQRYRVLTEITADAVKEAANSPELTKSLLESGNWVAAYAKTNGELPLAELVAKVGQSTVFVKGEISVLQGGATVIQVRSPGKFTVWLDDQELGSGSNIPVELLEGLHSISVRVDCSETPEATLLINLEKSPGSATQFVVVDGA